MTGVQNIQFIPTADQGQLQQIMDIQRRQQLAQQLLDNAKMPAPNDMAGNVVYKHSPLEYLARGASQAFGSSENLKAQQMAMELQGQQFNSMLGGSGSSSGQGVGGVTPQAVLRAQILSRGDQTAEKAMLDQAALTNEQKNAVGAGLNNAVDLAGAITAAQQGNTYNDRTIGGVQHVPVLNRDAARLAQPLIDSAGGQTPQSMSPPMGVPPAPMSLGGPPPPVQQTPLPPPAGQGAMNAPSGFVPRPPPITPDQGALGPVVPGSPAAGAALTPQPNPVAAVNVVNNANGDVTPPPIGDDPRYAGRVAAGAEKEKLGATTQADDAKTLNIMQSNLPVLLHRLQVMRDNSNKASHGYGVDEEGTGRQQKFAAEFLPDMDKANTLLKQAAAQSVLPELGPQLAQSGVKGNKFLETIANNAVGLDLKSSPAAKKAAIDNLQSQYISNLKATSSRLRAQGQAAPSDEDIDKLVSQNLPKVPGNAPKNIDPALWQHMTPQEQALFK